MKLSMLAGLALAVTLPLGGCATDPTNQLPSQMLDNLKHCKRTYIAAVGGLGVPGASLYIECPAQPPSAPAPSE